jgi:hypothetical protein
MSLTKVSYSLINGAYINVLDYGAKGDGTTDDTTAIQAAIDAAYGRTLYFPAGMYVHTGLNIHEGIMLIGEMPMSYQDADTYTTINGGTTLWKKIAGDSLTIEATNYPAADQDFQVGIWNINFAGARYTGSSFTSNTVTTGHGIVVNAGDEVESAIHLVLDNVFVFSMPQKGWRISGQGYGCNAGWIGANFCGQTGFWYSAEGFTNFGGEFYIAHYRGFANGQNGSTNSDKAGIYLDQRGQSVVVGLLTSSNNYGPNFMSGRGGFNIQELHCETQSGSPTASPIIFGDGTNNTLPSYIGKITVDPGNTYANNVITFNPYALSITIESLRIGDSGLVGNHVFFNTNAEYNRINQIWAGAAIKISDLQGTNYVASYQPAFNVRLTSSVTNVTGDATEYIVPVATENFDTSNSFNTSTYQFTVPVTGIYDLYAQVKFSGADGSTQNNFVIRIRTATDILASNQLIGLAPTTFIQTSFKKQLLQKGNQVYLTAIVSGGAKTVDIDSGDSATFFGGSLVMPTQTSGAPWF